MDIYKKARETIAADFKRSLSRRSEPIGMGMIFLGFAVGDELKWFQALTHCIEALEREGALFNAADYFVAFERCGLGLPGAGEMLLAGGIGDLGGGEFAGGDGLEVGGFGGCNEVGNVDY
jgi:hypothetical protein